MSALLVEYLWAYIFVILGGNVEQEDVSRKRMTTLVFLLLELSPFILFEIDFVSALYFEYLWNIGMVLGRNVEQD